MPCFIKVSPLLRRVYIKYEMFQNRSAIIYYFAQNMFIKPSCLCWKVNWNTFFFLIYVWFSVFIGSFIWGKIFYKKLNLSYNWKQKYFSSCQLHPWIHRICTKITFNYSSLQLWKHIIRIEHNSLLGDTTSRNKAQRIRPTNVNVIQRHPRRHAFN